MPTKEEDFKQRFSGILLDLTSPDQGEDLLLIGSLAARIIGHAGSPDWPTFKASLSHGDYSSLLTTFQTQGNALAQQGQRRQVRAIEVVAVALVARTQMGDPDIASNAPLLDQIIDDAIRAYRDAQAADPIIS